MMLLLVLLALVLLVLVLNAPGVEWLLSWPVAVVLLSDEARLSMEPDREGKELLWNSEMWDGGCAEGLLYE